ncbi:MAG TPA: DUF1893 domain-containing protein [Firmicutes bacterium]|nr:DUF1893 domain-containing protein [Bacillota bacterium]
MLEDNLPTDHNLTRAHNLLATGWSLAAVKKERAWLRQGRGIRPLYNLITELGSVLQGAALADAVVGKAAALLSLKAGLGAVWAGLISTPALELLQAARVEVRYNDQVPHILNHRKDNLCPMEMLVQNVSDPAEAYRLIGAKLVSMVPSPSQEKEAGRE